MRVRHDEEKDEYVLVDDMEYEQCRIGGAYIDRYLEWKNARDLVAEAVLLRNLIHNRHVRFEGRYVVVETERG